MQKLTATQAQLLNDVAECMLVRQMYVKPGVHQINPQTDHALLKATLAAQEMAETAGVDRETIGQALDAADAEAMRLTWGL